MIIYISCFGTNGLPYSSYSENKLHEPKTTRKTFADRAFSVAGPRIWDSLTYEIRDIKSIDIFKCKLKTFLFAKCYS